MREPLEKALAQARDQERRSHGPPQASRSISKKMKQRERPYEEIYDLLAIRVLVESVPDCYHALGIITTRLLRSKERIKDYIATQVERLSIAAHHGFGPGRPVVRDPDPYP